VMPQKPAIPSTEKEEIEMEEPLPEPPHTVVPNSEKAIPVKCFAKVDGLRYECDTKEIYFKATMMYTARIFSFKVKNASLINMSYYWKFTNSEGVLDLGFYTITPKNGSIRPESVETFEVKFLPTEVDERMVRVLECVITNLDDTQER